MMDWEQHLRQVDSDEARGDTLAAIDHALIELARLRRIEQAARARGRAGLDRAMAGERLDAEAVERARAFITRPDLCSVEACIDWIDGLANEVERLRRIEQAARDYVAAEADESGDATWVALHIALGLVREKGA